MKGLGFAAAAALVLAACTTTGGGSSPAPAGKDEERTIEVGGEPANYHGEVDVSGLEAPNVNVELGDFFFSPTVIAGQPGQVVSIELANKGDVPHTFTITGDVDEEIQPGGDAAIDVSIPASGSAVFFCRFHASQGMRGVLGEPPTPGAAGNTGGTGDAGTGGTGDAGTGDGTGDRPGPGGYGY
jgi:plastocyanin